MESLGSNITTTENELDEVNSQMASMKLTSEDLAKLQDQANAKQGAEENITIPTTASIKEKVDEQIANMQTVIDTIQPGSPVRNEAQSLKDDIAGKFNTLLDPNSDLTFTQQQLTAKQIDTALLHFRGLDIYDSSARMEL